LDCHRLVPSGPADFGNSRHSTTSFILLHALASDLKPSVQTGSPLNAEVISRMLGIRQPPDGEERLLCTYSLSGR
jgi:hypothetical protein